MANKSLTDLTARTTTEDSDLLHVNSGGTDYKETKLNFLQGNIYKIFSKESNLTSQVDALPEGTYIGKVNGATIATTGTPANTSYYVEVQVTSATYASIRLMSYSAGGYQFHKNKVNGTWSSTWVDEPYREEITSINNSLANSLHSVATVPSNGSKAVSVGGSTRAFLCVFGFSNEATQIYMVTSTSGGATYACPVKTSTGMSASVSGSTITLTNSTGSNAYACALVFSGSIEAT